jgi:dethiobiotin synthase
MNGFFITGTDTDVGKTVLTTCLASAFRASGRAPRAVKPLASGSEPPGGDATRIAQAAGHGPLGFACLPTPASPERAAREAGVTIDDEGLVAWCRAQVGDPLLMEGVGGWAVPLTEAITVEDLAMAMGHPVIIVAANRLGMLNHTLLTVEAVRESGLPIAGVVINNARDTPSDLQQWNVDDTRRWLGPTVDVAILDQVETEDDCIRAGQGIIETLRL